MARLLVGLDGTGTACVKIMKNNGDNPYSTPDSDYAKFAFNSKWETNVRFVGSDRQNGGNGNLTEFTPAGTNKTNFTRARIGYDVGYYRLFWNATFWAGQVDYTLPAFDIKEVNDAGQYTYCRIGVATAGYQGRTQTYSMAWAQEAGFIQNYSNADGDRMSGVTYAGIIVSVGFPDRNKRVVVWNLPGDEAAILNPPQAPVAGQMTVQINSSACRVAKPGYDVRTATRTQLAFDSANRPVKVVASGDIAVPNGTSVFDFSANLAGINVSGELVADVIQYKGSTIYFPCSPPSDADDYGANFYFSGNTLVFVNSGSTIRARILIISQDNTAQSSGSNKVFRQLTIGGTNVIQMLRPGAADPPNLADVIIDSRWPCLNILAKGVFNIPGGGGQKTTDIPFTSGGLFPFVKYWTIHGSGQPNGGFEGGTASGTKRIRLPYAKWARYNVPEQPTVGYFPGDCTFCELGANNARFYTYRGNPYRILVEEDGGTETESVTCEAYAIRYYIFGIPA